MHMLAPLTFTLAFGLSASTIVASLITPRAIEELSRLFEGLQ